MAHFARLDENNVVQTVIVVSNDDLFDEDGIEQETFGVAVCRSIFGNDTTWVQTSYNGNFRKQYGEPGFLYDATADVFYDPIGPFPSWRLDDNYDWQPPTPMPIDGKSYYWDEDSLTWVEVPTQETQP